MKNKKCNKNKTVALGLAIAVLCACMAIMFSFADSAQKAEASPEPTPYVPLLEQAMETDTYLAYGWSSGVLSYYTPAAIAAELTARRSAREANHWYINSEARCVVLSDSKYEQYKAIRSVDPDKIPEVNHAIVEKYLGRLYY